MLNKISLTSRLSVYFLSAAIRFCKVKGKNRTFSLIRRIGYKTLPKLRNSLVEVFKLKPSLKFLVIRLNIN